MTTMTKTTVAEIAARRGLRLDNSNPGGPRFIGANPYEPGGDDKPSHLKDGFCLFPPGSSIEPGGKDMGGAGWQRTPRRFYSSRKIAELEGIPYGEYEGSESDPHYKPEGSGPDPAGKWDNRSLEERGLNREGQKFFMISSPLNVDGAWGERRDFPTFHPDGSPGRHRRKHRFPQRQLLGDNPRKHAAKCDWDNRTKDLGMPVAYGLNYIQPGETVYLVNGELSVWLFKQEGLRAVCPLGEGRAEETYQRMIQAIAHAGAMELRVILDNDQGGQGGSVRAAKAAHAVGLPCVIYDLSTAPKVGFDASDLHEFWRHNQADEYPFLQVLQQQPIANAKTLALWEHGAEAIEAAEADAPDQAELNSIGRAAQRQKEKPTQAGEFRKCPKCKKFAVIEDAYADNGGWLCWKKADGCGEKFAADDKQIAKAAVKESKGDPVRELYELLCAHEMFHTTDGSRCIVIQEGVRRVTYEIDTFEFSEWVRLMWLEATGHFISDEHLSRCLKTLASRAKHRCPRREAVVRTGMHKGKIYIDLCNDAGEIIEIDGDGWRIVIECDLFFRRPHALLPLPCPVEPEHGDYTEVWDTFFSVLNYGTPRNKALIMAWMVASYYPGEPCPILFFTGQQGSAKSTLTKMIRNVLDPNISQVSQAIIDPRETVVAAENCRIMAFDNQGKIEKWASDLICAMVTGNSVSFRKLFKDKEQVIFSAQPAFIMNGIPAELGGIDLKDRSIIIDIPKILDPDRKSLREIRPVLEEVRPQLLAAICHALSCGLRNLPRVKEIMGDRNLKRMAEFGELIECCMEGMPLAPNEFYNAYSESIVESAAGDLDRFFVKVLLRFADEHNCEWQGVATELLVLLKDLATTMLIDEEAKAKIENSPYMQPGEKQQAIERLRDKAAAALGRMRDWPVDASRMGTMITSVAPSIRKVRRMEVEKMRRITAGVPYRIRRLRPDEFSETEEFLQQAQNDLGIEEPEANATKTDVFGYSD